MKSGSIRHLQIQTSPLAITSDGDTERKFGSSPGRTALFLWTLLLSIASIPTVAQPNLTITKTDLPDPVVAGTDLTYTITATNDGTADAPDVEISDPLPPGTTFVSATPSAGAACSTPPVGGSGTVTCTWAGATGAGISRTLTLVVHVDPGVLHGSTITNVATVVSSVLAMDASADTLVINQSSLVVTKDDIPDPVTAGEDITYAITATNNGPSVASYVAISDPLPPSTTFVSATPSAGGGCTTPPVGGTGTVTCTWAGLTGVGVVRSLTLAVNVPLTTPDGSTVTNTATAIPSVLANDATADTLVINQADLSVTKDDGVATAVPGQSVTYTITVSNGGGDLLSVDRNGALLRTIDPATAATLGSVPITLAGETVLGGNGLATHPGTGEPWAILRISGQSGRELVTIDATSGVATSVGNTGTGFAGLAFNDDGSLLWGVTGDGGSPSESLFSLSQLDATPTLLCTLGNGSDGETLGFNPADGTLYHASGHNGAGVIFETVDDTGVNPCAVTDIPIAGALDDEEAQALTWWSQEGVFLWKQNHGFGPLFRVTPGGAETLVGTMDHQAKGLAFLGGGSGGADVAGATVSDVFPPELSCTWTCVPSGGASCTAGPVAGDVFDVVDLPQGASVTYTAVCTIDPSVTGILTNTATVTEPAGVTDPNPSNNDATDVDVLTPEADLSVTKDDSQDPVAAGDPLSYTVTVDNAGPSDATLVVATDTLPAGVTFAATSGCANDPGGVPACDLGTISGGGSATYSIDVVVDAATPSGLITNQISVASDAGDPTSNNDTDSEFTLVDADPPIVTLIDSTAGTGDGVLAECEEAKVAISQLKVTFNEPVRDPPGNTGADDVTNPDNYRLLAAGADHDFTTGVCGPILPDDSGIAIGGVTYDGGTQTATLALAGGSLADSLYRLLICDGIRDGAGNPLDGDLDGTRGGDFPRTYRVDRADLFRGGHFDCSIDPWVTVSTDPEEIEYSIDDVDDSSVSGSAEVTNLSVSTDFSLGQCLAVAGGTSYALTGRVRLAMPGGGLLFITRSCDFYAGPDCTDARLLTETEFTFSSGTGGAWLPVASQMVAPAASASALCGFDLQTPAADDFDAHLDNLELRRLDGPEIFSDGFESGDVSAWSSSKP